MTKVFWVTGLLLTPLVAGCGTNVTEALLLAGESGARTALDVFISDFVSDVPDLFSIPPGPGEPVGGTPTDTTGGTAPTGDTGGTAPTGGTGTADLVGDAAAGGALFEANSCLLCHCDDASGGCLPAAPNIQGKDLATVQERLQGETPHPGGKFPDLTPQDIADIVAFLGAQAGT